MIKQILKTSALFFTFLFVTGVCTYLALTYFIRNEDSVVVPELVGKEVVQSLEILSGLGLNTKVSGSEYSSTTPKNHVIFQDPEPGTIIKKDRDVRIVFSKGTMHVFAPALRRMPIQDAEQSLDESGLKTGVISYVYDETAGNTTVISQYPEQGEDLPRASAVNLLISLGKRPRDYVMANLTGMSIDDAIQTISDMQLKVGKITRVINKKVPLDVVVSHEPQNGSQVLEGDTVNLSINRKQEGGSNRAYQPDAGPRLFRHTVGNGFLKKHIRAQMSCLGSIFEVYNDDVRPGEVVWVMIPVNDEATVFLYEDDILVKTQFFD